jgi:hypothetical protein
MNSQGSNQFFRDSKPWGLMLILTLCGFVVLAAPITARSEGLLWSEGTKLNLVDLIADWTAYRDHDVVVEGQLHCVDRNYCDLIPASGLRRTVFVNISHLGKEKRDYLQINCSEKNCLAGVFGSVGSWELYAFAVQEADS